MLSKIAVIVALSLLFQVPAHAQEVESRLAQIAGRLEAANSLFQSDDGLNMTELSSLAIELENTLTEMREISRDYGQTRQEIEQKFRDQSQELSEVLGYMATKENSPAPDFLLHPEGALGAIHANMIVGTVVPQLEDKVAGIAVELSDLMDLARREKLLKDSTVVAVDQINKLRRELVQAERQGVERHIVSDPDVLDALFAVSDNLTDFVRGLQQLPLQGQAPPSFLVRETKGTWKWPATGERLDELEGMVIQTRQQLISSPVPGTVRFAAKFLDYGQTIILEPQKGYVLVMAGFDDFLVEEGDVIREGQLVGYFGENSASLEETSPSALENPLRELYVEMRKNGVAQDLNEYFVLDTEDAEIANRDE